MNEFENNTQTEPAPEPDVFEQYIQPEVQTVPVAVEDPKQENVIAGVVGAFLLALAGGILYFVIYQFGYIAGICGLVTVVLANFGYQKFAGVKHSVKGVVISVILSVFVIFLAEFFGLAYSVYDAFKTEYAISFFDAVRATPDFLVDPEILPSVLLDLGIAYVLGAVASFSTIRRAIASGKKA